MTMGEKRGIMGGVVGATAGGLGWIVFLGLKLKSPVISFPPMILAVLWIYIASRLVRGHPEKRFLVGGLTLLWIVLWNLIFLLNLLNSEVGRTWGGANRAALLQITYFMVVFAVLGFVGVIIDLTRKP
jgi:hypothetical protein